MKFEKYASISSLGEAVTILTDKGNYDKALWLIYDYVERIITEPLCTSQIYGSKMLDNLCQRIGNANFVTVNHEF